MTRYINPYTDFGFKKLFGEEANKDLLIDFLNSVLPDSRQITDLCFNNPEQLPDNTLNRMAIFDIACTGNNNEKFTVEMQKVKQIYFKDRALFYSSYPIQRQLQKGDWDFKLNPVYFVAVLDFEYDQDEERRKLYRLVTLKDEDGYLFLDTLQMIFLQMPCFNLTESELVTKRDKWLFFLKNLESFDSIPSILREPIFEKAFHTAEFIKYPPELQDAYNSNRKIYWDNKNAFATAEIEGEKKGVVKGIAIGEKKGIVKGIVIGEKKGIAKGIIEGKKKGIIEGKKKGIIEGEKKGIAKGIIEGKKQGETDGIIKVARNLKQSGMDIGAIVDATGLSIKEIKKL